MTGLDVYIGILRSPTAPPPDSPSGCPPRRPGDSTQQSVQAVRRGSLSQLIPKLDGGNSNIFYVHPRTLGKIPILTNIFQMGWNHQPVNDHHDPLMTTWMSRDGSWDQCLLNGLFHLLINGIYWGYYPFTNHLLTSWDIQAPWSLNSCLISWRGGFFKVQKKKTPFYIP